MDIVDKMVQYMEKRNNSTLLTTGIEMSIRDLSVVVIEVLSWLRLEYTIKYDPKLTSAGKSRKDTPTIIEVGPLAFINEEELANTIAHELNHARDWLKGGIAPDQPTGTHPGAYSAGDALAEYIRGER